MNNWNQLNNDRDVIWIRKLTFGFLILTFQLKFNKIEDLYELSSITDTDRTVKIYTNQIAQATYSANLLIQEALGNIYNAVVC